MVKERGELRGAKDLLVYQKAYALAMEIFRVSRAWPAEENWTLQGTAVISLNPIMLV